MGQYKFPPLHYVRTCGAATFWFGLLVRFIYLYTLRTRALCRRVLRYSGDWLCTTRRRQINSTTGDNGFRSKQHCAALQCVFHPANASLNREKREKFLNPVRCLLVTSSLQQAGWQPGGGFSRNYLWKFVIKRLFRIMRLHFRTAFRLRLPIMGGVGGFWFGFVLFWAVGSAMRVSPFWSEHSFGGFFMGIIFR